MRVLQCGKCKELFETKRKYLYGIICPKCEEKRNLIAKKYKMFSSLFICRKFKSYGDNGKIVKKLLVEIISNQKDTVKGMENINTLADMLDTFKGDRCIT